MTIYVWPPQLGMREQRWSVDAPVQVSRSILTGARYVSAHSRTRQVVEFEVSIRSRHGYGIMEGLKALLDGGRNFVRLYWYGPTDVTGIRGAALSWDVTWDVTWEGHITGTPDGTRIGLSGLTPSKRVARAGEFIAYAGQTRRLIADVTSNASGAATAAVDTPFTGTTARTVILPAQATGIFEAVEMPGIPWLFDREGSVVWTFAEMFPDEIGTQAELAPWGY